MYFSHNIGADKSFKLRTNVKKSTRSGPHNMLLYFEILFKNTFKVEQKYGHWSIATGASHLRIRCLFCKLMTHLYISIHIPFNTGARSEASAPFTWCCFTVYALNLAETSDLEKKNVFPIPNTLRFAHTHVRPSRHLFKAHSLLTSPHTPLPAYVSRSFFQSCGPTAAALSSPSAAPSVIPRASV